MNVSGIHHVTAVSAKIVDNLAFYTGVLGMRLVKKSVNQDDVSAYHLFYADTVGSPGMDLTFFDWPMSPANIPGPASVALTTLRVNGASMSAWEQRLTSHGVIPDRDQDLAGRTRITFADHEGQRLALVDDSGLAGEVVAWTKVVPEQMAIRGIFGVDIDSARPDMTKRILRDVLGYQEATSSRFVASGEDFASEIIVHELNDHPMGQVGAGGVHHVAFRVRNDDELMEFKDKLESLGFRTSGYIDRFYFHSLYFREPGGVLFELATDGPGFGSDEDPEHLGEKLALPPFLESKRGSIERDLKPLPKPAYLE
jgi:glyoxalase family protein